MTIKQGDVITLQGHSKCMVDEVTDNFVEVTFDHSPTAFDYDYWFKRGYKAMFEPKERTCNRRNTYHLIFKALNRVAPKETLPVTPFYCRPELGQKAWVYGDNEGRVVSFLEDSDNPYVEVLLLSTGLSCKYPPEDVTIVNSLGYQVRVRGIHPNVDLSGREKDKAEVKQHIHHLLSLLDSESVLEEAQLVGQKASEAIERL